MLKVSNPVLRRAFSDTKSSRNDFSIIRPADPDLSPLDASGNVPMVQHTAQIYRRGHPNCLAVGIASGIRGGVFGAAIGGVMGASNAAQSGYRGSAALTYAGHSAIRNAAGFASWTALYSASRCGLIGVRRQDDILNPAIAGAFTGAALTILSLRGHWRYNQQVIVTNAAGSALIAVVFGAMGGL